jgi:hypothetical protein
MSVCTSRRRTVRGSLLSQVWWGSTAAGRTVEDRCGGCSHMRGSWWRGCSSQDQTTWYIRRHKRPRPNASQRLTICWAEMRSHHTQPISSLPINPTLSLATLSYAPPTSACTALLAFLLTPTLLRPVRKPCMLYIFPSCPP